MDSVKIIRTQEDYLATMARVDELMEIDFDENSPLSDELDALAALIEVYENKHFAIDTSGVTPLDIIKLRMEQNDLTQQDMQQYLGSASKVSEVLNGKRSLSLTMIRKLHTGLHIPADLLLSAV